MNVDKWLVFLTSEQNVFLNYVLSYSQKGLYKYDQEIYDLFMESFDLFPISCVINGKFIALHGGISPELKTVTKLIFFNNLIFRLKILIKLTGWESLQDRVYSGNKFLILKILILSDLLWSDPVDNEDGICENIFRNNDVRGCSYFFGLDAVNKFLDHNNLVSVIRAHEAQINGYTDIN